ncbi:MAG TPA: hypothetical protein VGS22_25755 [Thermoanaerobaculia bacterium]|nr:hypothetical protein [Thermoanaerobaculia bacterium]
MKRAVLTVSLSLALALTQDALAQESLSKRILVYIDLSGSMKPAEANSPFSTTVEALQLLLGESGFIAPRDEVRFIFFDDEIVGDTPWSPGSSPGTLLTLLRQKAEEVLLDPERKSTTLWTDFQVVFDNLRSQVTRDTNFNRQVVIIASDFVHEPSRSGPKARDSSVFWQRTLADWEKIKDTEVPSLTHALGDTDRNPFVLAAAPLNSPGEGEGKVRKQVLSDLESIPGVTRLDLGPGGLGATKLAQEIRRRLYFPLKVVVRSNHREHKLQVDVENPNAAEVNIDRIELSCFSADDANENPIGDPASLSITGTELAKPIAAQKSGSDEIALSPDSCLRTATRFKVRVTSKEGAEGAAKRDVAWIDAEQVESSIESNFFFKQSVLRLVVKMRGDAPPNTEFQIRIRRDGERDGPEILKGNFDTPRLLEVVEPKRYLFVFDISEILRKQLIGAEIEVQVAMAKELATKPEDDLRSSHANSAQSTVAGAALFGTLVLFLLNHHRSRDLIFKILETHHYLYILFSGTSAFLFGWLRPWLLEFRYLSGPLLWTAVASLSFSPLAYGVSRSILNNKLAKIASGREAPSDSVLESLPNEYRKPWYWALAVLLLVCVLGWFLAPRGVEGAEPVPVTMVPVSASH